MFVCMCTHSFSHSSLVWILVGLVGNRCVCVFLHPCDSVRAGAPAAAFVLSLLPSMANVDFCPFFFPRTEFALKETMSTGGVEDDIPQGERKTVTDFCYLLDKSKQLFNGLRSVGFRYFKAGMYI